MTIKMEVDSGKDRNIYVCIRKRKQNVTHIIRASGTIKRKLGVFDIEYFPKKQCVSKDTIITLKPSYLNHTRDSNCPFQTAIYRPFQIMKSRCEVPQSINVDTYHGLRLSDYVSTYINSCPNKNFLEEYEQPFLNAEDELSNKMQRMNLSDIGYNERKIENALLLYAKKKKGMLRLSGGAIGFRSEDVQEFCTDMVLDLEKWLQEQYHETLMSKLKEQYLNYLQFSNDNLRREGTLPNFDAMTLEENFMEPEPDYLS